MSKRVQSPELEGMYRIYMVEFYATRVITYFLNDEEAQSFSAWPFCLVSSASMQIMLKEQYLRSTDHNHTPEKILHIFFTSKRMVTLSGTFIHMERVNIYTHTHTHTFSSDFPVQSQLQIPKWENLFQIWSTSPSSQFNIAGGHQAKRTSPRGGSSGHGQPPQSAPSLSYLIRVNPYTFFLVWWCLIHWGCFHVPNSS